VLSPPKDPGTDGGQFDGGVVVTETDDILK
jgi:hypothetical protein